jgi:hypothetical protein
VALEGVAVAGASHGSFSIGSYLLRHALSLAIVDLKISTASPIGLYDRPLS